MAEERSEVAYELVPLRSKLLSDSNLEECFAFGLAEKAAGVAKNWSLAVVVHGDDLGEGWVGD